MRKRTPTWDNEMENDESLGKGPEHYIQKYAEPTLLHGKNDMETNGHILTIKIKIRFATVIGRL